MKKKSSSKFTKVLSFLWYCGWTPVVLKLEPVPIFTALFSLHVFIEALNSFCSQKDF